MNSRFIPDDSKNHARLVSVLGSTGSIGRSTLDVIRRHPKRFRIMALGAHSNVDLLANQITEFGPELVAVGDPDAATTIREMFPRQKVVSEVEGLCEAAALPVDIVLCAVVGAVGLRPILAAIEAGNRVALANKEPLVMAGPFIMERARARSVTIMPVDSEHSAIFQCMAGHRREDVACIHLTASGGPFYRRDRESLAKVSPEEAANHPTWDMGTKISVDSSTLMNKGLEVIEARWLFDIPLDNIHVVIHPQSIVHSLVEFTDGSILAHLGLTDMRFPIEYALTWPERVAAPMGRLDLTTMRELTFAAPDFSEFPCLGHALDAARRGGTATAALNAANEAAVAAFCSHRIPFLGIPEVVGRVLDTSPVQGEVTLESVLETDREARRLAETLINTIGV